MEIYLVGGAVRDELMGLTVNEKDWVVVGSTPEEMLQKGFKPVGKDFPVFLHPQTNEEYALARSEKKVSVGYSGFVFHTETTITLEEDLKRRDLTINAIAKKADGTLIDPFNGKDDIKRKLLRHVSDAFIEDPVRVLRIARFNAKFPDFHIAEETKKLIQHMMQSRELNSLVGERVFLELEKVFAYRKPSYFFKALATLGVFNTIFPHMVIDEKQLATLDMPNEPIIRFCLMLSLCDNEQIQLTCKQLKVPKDFKDMALIANTIPLDQALNASSLLNTLYKLDAFRRKIRLDRFAAFCQAQDKQQLATYLCKSHTICNSLNISGLIKGKEQKQIPNIIHQARLSRLKDSSLFD